MGKSYFYLWHSLSKIKKKRVIILWWGNRMSFSNSCSPDKLTDVDLSGWVREQRPLIFNLGVCDCSLPGAKVTGVHCDCMQGGHGGCKPLCVYQNDLWPQRCGEGLDWLRLWGITLQLDAKPKATAITNEENRSHGFMDINQVLHTLVSSYMAQVCPPTLLGKSHRWH